MVPAVASEPFRLILAPKTTSSSLGESQIHWKVTSINPSTSTSIPVDPDALSRLVFVSILVVVNVTFAYDPDVLRFDVRLSWTAP